MKTCSKCLIEKAESCFIKDKRYSDGLFSWCKECKKSYARQHNHIYARWVSANKSRVKATKDRYVQGNKEQVKLAKKKWYLNNSKHQLALTRKYQASKKQRTPKWLVDCELNEMIVFYKNCPTGYEVDHIIPIQGKNVSGLHVPWNLQYLKTSDNRKKSNKVT